MTAAEEEALTGWVRLRVAAAAGGRRGRAVDWTRPERSPERDDFRARAALDHGQADRLVSGRPWRARVAGGGVWRKVRWGVAIVVTVDWRGLASGKGGAVTVADAVRWFETERAAWRRRFGAKPFYAAVAATFAGPIGASPVDGLALLAWEGGAWRFHGRETQPELSDLFFPSAPEKSKPPARWKGMSTFCERLLSPFHGRHRKAQARLADRSREFQEARTRALQLQQACERHAAAGDWSPEMLQVQRANAAEAARQAALRQRQVAALQQNLQLLTTAKLGGELIADARLPLAADRFAALDRAHYETQARRQEVTQAERAFNETLLGELPPGPELADWSGVRPEPDEGRARHDRVDQGVDH